MCHYGIIAYITLKFTLREDHKRQLSILSCKTSRVNLEAGPLGNYAHAWFQVKKNDN